MKKEKGLPHGSKHSGLQNTVVGFFWPVYKKQKSPPRSVCGCDTKNIMEANHGSTNRTGTPVVTFSYENPTRGRASQGGSAIPRTPKQSLLQAKEVPSVLNINVKMTERYGTVISFHTDKNRYYT